MYWISYLPREPEPEPPLPPPEPEPPLPPNVVPLGVPPNVVPPVVAPPPELPPVVAPPSVPAAAAIVLLKLFILFVEATLAVTVYVAMNGARP
jgi:hypothetical protein